MQLEQLLDVLNYTQSPNYYNISARHDPSTEHIYRAARKAGVKGTYVIHISPSNNKILPVRPVVYVASAQTVEAARIIHRKLWNLGTVPFLLVLLPNHIRVYTGFDYSPYNENDGLIDLVGLNLTDIRGKLSYLFAQSIDSGSIWKSQAKHIVSEKRVNIHLLKNLKNLTEYLVNHGLSFYVTHSLIEKYLYIRCLSDRNILFYLVSENNIDLQNVVSNNATISGLNKLNEALKKRFNRDIFPFPLQGSDAITDEIVSLVANAFFGNELVLNQLHLDFTFYDFSYIRVETISSIYEQILNAQDKKTNKIAYTPEPLADYLLCEINQSKPLYTRMKVLDPCCSCGIFLVLAYRRLVEMELVHSSNGKLSFRRLSDILIESIYGFEQNRDACYVAEFSLILAMLDYVEPIELHNHKDFKFPILYNHQIFESDLLQTKHKFDWIVGNYSKIKLKPKIKDQNLLSSITEFLQPNGYVGLIIHAESLFNHESQEYRRQFFQENEVARITNFTHLGNILFNESEAPVATIVFTKAEVERNKPEIIHFAPSVINQIHNQTWMITINSNDTQLVSPDDAETGETKEWKLALWGNYRDKRTVKRLNRVFSTNLGAVF
ncbi:hypothetical protein NIES4071_50860 [Calothrix sp. NIES-4071]|nr:hypothetical protein NIES4071_50860 [Calothrix sp. NIES-4071]BAZ59394.1 hypothetical protein NIES4105_50810 [Calothrix sp. NIES-4105]